eukprot:RCo040717
MEMDLMGESGVGEAMVPAVRMAVLSAEAVRREYALVRYAKGGVVALAHSRSLGHSVYLKYLGCGCPETISVGVPDEVALTYALQRCRDPWVGGAFARPLGAFWAPMGLHPRQLRS